MIGTIECVPIDGGGVCMYMCCCTHSKGWKISSFFHAFRCFCSFCIFLSVRTIGTPIKLQNYNRSLKSNYRATTSKLGAKKSAAKAERSSDQAASEPGGGPKGRSQARRHKVKTINYYCLKLASAGAAGLAPARKTGASHRNRAQPDWDQLPKFMCEKCCSL